MHEVRKNMRGMRRGVAYVFFFFPRAREALGSKIAKRLLFVTSAAITTFDTIFVCSSFLILPLLSFLFFRILKARLR